MFYDIDIWRLVITLGFAKSLIWKKDDELCFFHIGTIEGSDARAIKIVFLPFLLMIGLTN